MSRTQPRVLRVYREIRPSVVIPLDRRHPDGRGLVLNEEMAALLAKALAETDPGAQR